MVLIIQFENLQNIKLFFIEFSNTVLPKQLSTPVSKGGNLMLRLSPSIQMTCLVLLAVDQFRSWNTLSKFAVTRLALQLLLSFILTKILAASMCTTVVKKIFLKKRLYLLVTETVYKST